MGRQAGELPVCSGDFPALSGQTLIPSHAERQGVTALSRRSGNQQLLSGLARGQRIQIPLRALAATRPGIAGLFAVLDDAGGQLRLARLGWFRSLQ